MKYLSLCILLVFVTGCTTATSILKSYVGKDIREAALDYGNAANAIDMGDGKRAFQWVLTRSYTMPINSNTSGSVSNIGNSTWFNSNTMVTGGQTINSQCVYTLIAEWNQTTESWIVTDFRKPKFSCQ